MHQLYSCGSVCVCVKTISVSLSLSVLGQLHTERCSNRPNKHSIHTERTWLTSPPATGHTTRTNFTGIQPELSTSTKRNKEWCLLCSHFISISWKPTPLSHGVKFIIPVNSSWTCWKEIFCIHWRNPVSTQADCFLLSWHLLSSQKVNKKFCMISLQPLAASGCISHVMQGELKVLFPLRAVFHAKTSIINQQCGRQTNKHHPRVTKLWSQPHNFFMLHWISRPPIVVQGLSWLSIKFEETQGTQTLWEVLSGETPMSYVAYHNSS